jgi:hypothetical protein
MAGLLPFDQLEYVFGESEKDGHVRSLRIYHGMTEERIIHLEYKCVAVNQKKFLIHVNRKLNPKDIKSFENCLTLCLGLYLRSVNCTGYEKDVISVLADGTCASAFCCPDPYTWL